MLWGLWLVVLAAFFSAGGYPNSYYVAALVPAIGALCGTGIEVAWRRRERAATRACLAGALLASAGYGIYLLDGGSGVPGWLIPAAICAALAGLAALGGARGGRAPSGASRAASWRSCSRAGCCFRASPRR